MEMVGKILLGAVMLFVAVLVSAYVLSNLWLLFIVPLGLPAISVAHAYGINLLISLFRLNAFKRNEKQLTFEDFAAAVFLSIFISLMALGMGNFAALFM